MFNTMNLMPKQRVEGGSGSLAFVFTQQISVSEIICIGMRKSQHDGMMEQECTKKRRKRRRRRIKPRSRKNEAAAAAAAAP